jgi:hypothetical protein
MIKAGRVQLTCVLIMAVPYDKMAQMHPHISANKGSQTPACLADQSVTNRHRALPDFEIYPKAS